MSERRSARGRLAGKVAVVTGAGRGIGRAYAHALAAEGAAIVVNDIPGRDGSPADEVVAEIEAAGGRAVANHDSVTDFAGAEQMMRAAQENFGRLDILIANAGISRPAWITEASESDWADVLAVHGNGTFNCIRHAAPLIAQQGGGTIITTGDVTTDLHFPRLAAYRAAKAAIAVLTLYAAHELAEKGINVNSIMPGATDTRMQRAFYDSLGSELDSFRRRASLSYQGEERNAAPTAPPESVPPLGVFLCSDAGRRITGRLFALHREDVRVVVSHTEVLVISPESGTFSVDELERRVPGWLAPAPAPVETVRS